MTFKVVVSAVLFLVGIGCMVRANLLFREILVEINRLLPKEQAISLDGFARHRFFEILGGYKALYPDGKLVLTESGENVVALVTVKNGDKIAQSTEHDRRQ